MKRISNLLILAVLAIGMGLTSCEGLDDILGKWSRPTPGSSTGGVETSISIDPTLALKVGETGQLTATVNPAGTAVTWSSDQEAVATVDVNGLVTAKADGTATITAMAGDKSATCTVTVTEVYTAKDYKEASWDGTNNKVVFTKKTAPSDPTVLTNSVTSWSGWYTVSGEVTINANVTLSAETHLILQDGAKLTVNNYIDGTSSNKYNLSIYGQANQSGQLVVNNSTANAITFINTLEVHSCEVTATSSYGNGGGFYSIDKFNVYGGSVDAENTGLSNGYGILLASSGSMNIYGGDVKAVGKGTYDPYSCGITSISATITVYGGKLWAECAGYKALYSGVTLAKGAGFTGKIEYSSDKSDWSETVDASAKYVRVGY